MLLWTQLQAKSATTSLAGCGQARHAGLAVGGEKSFGPTMAAVMRFAATDVQEVVIPGSEHLLMEEQPGATVAAVVRSLTPSMAEPRTGPSARTPDRPSPPAVARARAANLDLPTR